MNRIILSFISFIFTMSIFAQQIPIKFMGIPVDGTLANVKIIK